MSARKRWPNGVAHLRDEAADLITSALSLQGEAQDLLDKSQQHIKTNPQLKEMMDLRVARLIAQSKEMLAHALRYLEEAKHGL
jgi:hypothetical protein